MNRCEPLDWFFRFSASELGLRACPFDGGGGRDPDNPGLSPLQRAAATKSSRIRTALAQLSTHDQFVLETCYRPRPGDHMNTSAPAQPWIDRLCGDAQHDIECHRLDAQRERSFAKAALAVACRTRDVDGVNSAVARAAAHAAAEARAVSRQRDAEQVLRRAAKVATDEAERAQSRFEAAMREVVAAQVDLAAFGHSKRLEVLQLDVAVPRPKRMTAKQKALDKVARWVVAMMGGMGAA
jgi:hypothetical protein